MQAFRSPPSLAERQRKEAWAHDAFLQRLFGALPRPACGVPYGGNAPTESVPEAEEKNEEAVQRERRDPVQDLNFWEALEMQNLLILEYRKEDFQEALHRAWAEAKGNHVAELRARQELCLPIQGPIIEKFGFEASRRGVALSTRAFQGKAWSWHQEIMDRNEMMSYLVNPAAQNTKWINGFEEAPLWWQRCSIPAPAPKKELDVASVPSDVAVRQNPYDGAVYTFERLQETYGADYSKEELAVFWDAEMKPLEDVKAPEAPVKEETSGGAPRSLKPGESAEAVEEERKPTATASLDDAIKELGRLQVMLAVPTVSQIRTARPLRRLSHEVYVAQFVLQSTTRGFSKFLSSEEGKAKFHPFLNPSRDGGGEDDGSFGWLDDKTYALYQTNGIARTEETILSQGIKCKKTGAPGHYIEIKMLVARRRKKGVPGQYGSGIKAARSFKTREDVEANLFYSWTSCWQMYACTSSVGEFGEEDTGERVLIRRSAKDFTQHHFHDFPVAKHLAELLDKECETLIAAFSQSKQEVQRASALDAVVQQAAEKAAALPQYQLLTLRSWQTYECDERPPEADLGVQLVSAARCGNVAMLRRLVLEFGCDCDTIISEFGAIGMGRNGYFTRCELGFAEERNALIAAVEAGYLSVVLAIIELAKEGRATLNVVCHEWNPSGIGGDCLRPQYSALDQSCLYHREEIKDALLKARARYSRECPPAPKRENPFTVRMKRDRGEYTDSGWQRTEYEDRYADFTFMDPSEDVQMDGEMRKIVKEIRKELDPLSTDDYNKHFKKLCLKWHPDKHPEENKSMATRVFQYLQRIKTDAWESKAWTA